MTQPLLTAAIDLFVAIDPVSAAAIFAALAGRADQARKRLLAVKGTVIGGAVLLLFAICGQAMMSALGISFATLNIVGGTLLILVAYTMVFPHFSSGSEVTNAPKGAASRWFDLSVYPIAMPLIAGPGAITTVVVFMCQAEQDSLRQLGVLCVLGGVLLITYLGLQFAAAVTRWLGLSRIVLLSRALGVVLGFQAVELAVDGLAGNGIMLWPV